MPGKIDAYVDCGMQAFSSTPWTVGFHSLIAALSVSPYSYYATLYLRKNRKALESHGIEVEYAHPWLLHGMYVC